MRKPSPYKQTQITISDEDMQALRKVAAREVLATGNTVHPATIMHEILRGKRKPLE